MSKKLPILNKAFENRVRLGIMSLLLIETEMEFKLLKEALDLTDGNLASHIKSLEKLDYITVNKQFVDRKPNTSYTVSKLGKREFLKHLDALETILKKHK